MEDKGGTTNEDVRLGGFHREGVHEIFDIVSSIHALGEG